MYSTKLMTTTVLIFATFGCATKTVQLSSEPKASVFISTDFTSEYKELGQTPIELDVKKVTGDSDFAFISFKAKGYDNYRVALPSKFSSGSIEVKLNEQEKVTDEELKKEIEDKVKASYESQISTLTELIKTQQGIHEQKLASLKNENKLKNNQIFNKVMEIQNALQTKKMSKAGKALAELRYLEAPESLILTLEGNFEFISGKYSRAIASYTRALNVDPGNVELAGIIKDLKKVIR